MLQIPVSLYSVVKTRLQGAVDLLRSELPDLFKPRMKSDSLYMLAHIHPCKIDENQILQK